MIRSRLKRKIERQSRANLFLSIFGVIIILIFALKFGIPMLINFSLLMEAARAHKGTKTPQKQTVFVSSPIMNPIPYATNSATISISGTATSGDNVKLYINNELISQTVPKKSGTFIFNNVTLNQGENTVETKAEINNSQSDFSQAEVITYDNKTPSLSIDSPTDGQSFSKDENPILVKGKTDPGDNVTVNGFWAIVENDGTFSYRLTLTNGDNQIKVITADAAGNKTEKDLHVTYSQ